MLIISSIFVMVSIILVTMSMTNHNIEHMIVFSFFGILFAIIHSVEKICNTIRNPKNTMWIVHDKDGK